MWMEAAAKTSSEWEHSADVLVMKTELTSERLSGRGCEREGGETETADETDERNREN